MRATNPRLRAAFRVPSHLTPQECLALYRLALRARSIAEIGSYVGASACCFGAARKEQATGMVVCIDTWNNDAMSEGERDTWLDFQRNTKAIREFIVPIRGFSTDVIEQVRESCPHLDLLFIDGDHSYEGVRADWEAYKPLLPTGSVVAFHDYGWAEGVRRLVHEDVLPLTIDHAQLPNLWWGTLR